MKKVLCMALAIVMVLSALPVVAVMAAKEMFEVSAVTITGIDTPYAGKKPDMTAAVPDGVSYIIEDGGISWAEYDADWEWQRDLEAGDTFRAGYIYVVWVDLYVTNNVSFTKSTSATINGQTANTSGWSENLKEMTAYYAFDVCKTAIDNVTLTVVEPIVGRTPTFAKVSTDQYESKNSDPKPSNQSNGVVWTNMDTSVNLSVSNQFKENGKYSVTYSLYPKEGYAFSEKLTATINGKPALVRHEDGYVRIRLENLAASYSVIPSVAITDVTEPVVGKTPDYSVIATGNNFVVQGRNDDRWVNGVAWVEFVSGAEMGMLMKTTDTFKAGNRYSIYVDLASTNTSYVFDREKTQGTVNGKAAFVMPEGSIARVIYAYSTLTQITVSEVEIHVTAPATGAKPTFDKIDAAGYYSDNNGNPVAAYKNGIAWYKTAYSYIAAGTTETFEAGKAYTMKISLLPKDGYAFSKNLTATVNGKAATVTQNDDGSVLLEIVLNTPKAPHTHTLSDWQSDDLDHWKICTDGECGSIVVPKQMHSNTDEDGKCDTCGYQLPIEVPDISEPSATEPDVTEPSATEPDVTEPSATEPDVTEPSATEPDATQGPVITLQPQSPNYPEYSVAIYTVKAQGSNLQATWYMEWLGKTYTISDIGGAMQDWEPYAGESYGARKLDDNTFAFVFEGIEADLDGAYIWCVIEDGHYDVTSQKNRISVGNPNMPPEIISIPSELIVEQGTEAEIRCVAKAPDGSQLSFLWYETPTGKREDIFAVNEGAETSDYLLCDTSAVGTRNYICKVESLDGGMTYSSVVSVTVFEKQPEPTQPQNPTEPTTQTTPSEQPTVSTEDYDPETQAPTMPTNTPDGSQNNELPWWVFVIVAVVAVGIGFGIVIIVTKKKA